MFQEWLSSRWESHQKNDYRKYKITNDVNDDYGTMKEVIYRRYFKVLKENLEMPDLIIVDGGIGQINVAREVISSLGLKIEVCGLKKMIPIVPICY